LLRSNWFAGFRVMATLADTLVPDERWALVALLLPPAPRPWWGGRVRAIPDRACFAAIIYMARTSTPWRLLPAGELGCGSSTTVRRRLDQWLAAGVFEQLQRRRARPARDGGGDRLDPSQRGCHERTSTSRGRPRRSQSGRPRQARLQTPPCNRQQRPAVGGGGHRGKHSDGVLLAAMVDDVPVVRTPTGQRRKRPAKLHADKAYDSRANRAELRRRSITSRIARRGMESSKRLGRHRWRIERSLS
jgi:transposase